MLLRWPVSKLRVFAQSVARMSMSIQTTTCVHQSSNFPSMKQSSRTNPGSRLQAAYKLGMQRLMHRCCVMPRQQRCGRYLARVLKGVKGHLVGCAQHNACEKLKLHWPHDNKENRPWTHRPTKTKNYGHNVTKQLEPN